MCYLIVKNFKQQGSLAIEINNSEELVGLSEFLTARLKDTEKQVVTISDLEMWQEYAPFTVVNEVGDFIKQAERM